MATRDVLRLVGRQESRVAAEWFGADLILQADDDNFPTEAGNAAIKKGVIPNKLKQILDELKPEAAFFAEDQGMRTGYIVFDMAEPSDLPRIAEPFFHAFNASITVRPAMTMEDLTKAGPSIERAVKNYG